MHAREIGESLLSMAECFRKASEPNQLVQTTKSILAEVGEFHFAAGVFGGSRTYEQCAIAVDYPPRWISHYLAKGYLNIDPTISRMVKARIPLEWGEFDELSNEQRELFADVRELGIKSGLTVPIHAPGSITFIASFAYTENAVPGLRPLLTCLAGNMYERHVQFQRADDPLKVRLTARERECLTWVACGKSSWDIGTILGISENTVNFHLKKAFGKLGGKGRLLCVVKAIALGLIEP